MIVLKTSILCILFGVLYIELIFGILLLAQRRGIEGRKKEHRTDVVFVKKSRFPKKKMAERRWVYIRHGGRKKKRVPVMDTLAVSVDAVRRRNMTA